MAVDTETYENSQTKRETIQGAPSWIYRLFKVSIVAICKARDFSFAISAGNFPIFPLPDFLETLQLPYLLSSFKELMRTTLAQSGVLTGRLGEVKAKFP